MDELFPKFIIEDDMLILSKVIFHRELVTDKKLVKGGGWFRYDSESKTFSFYGESCDFGRAELSDVIKCFENKKIYTNQIIEDDISEKFKFTYQKEDGEIIKLN